MLTFKDRKEWIFEILANLKYRIQYSVLEKNDKEINDLRERWIRGIRKQQKNEKEKRDNQQKNMF